jgi:hypothetical protein
MYHITTLLTRCQATSLVECKWYSHCAYVLLTTSALRAVRGVPRLPRYRRMHQAHQGSCWAGRILA